MDAYRPIRELLDRVRRRWRTLRALQAVMRSGLALSAVLGAAIVAAQWLDRSPIALALLGVVAVVLAAGALAWGLAPVRRTPGDRQIARFIEERAPALDDRLASAVDVATSDRSGSSPGLVEPMLRDAARRVEQVDLGEIVPGRHVWKAALRAGAVALVVAALALLSRGPARQAYDAGMLALFPSRVTLEVIPGDARVQAGAPLVIEARLVGNRAPVVARVEAGDGERWQTTEMKKAGAGFALAVGSVTTPFKYRVVAAGLTSPTYSVAVARPPRVTRIDVDYVYPTALGLKPRSESDSGDIYAPAGTDVRLRVHTDPPASNGQLTLASGEVVGLSPSGQAGLGASLKIVADNSYRVGLIGADGLSSAGDTEYFIRALDDRSPEVRIVAPAADRSVTKLEEVDIEAQAEDDYGVDRFELVYAVRGGREHVLPFSMSRRATSVTGSRTLYLEDLGVEPGDFVSYYVRARDVGRGRQANEARSDIFFLEIKPFEQEFTLAQSQGTSGGAGNSSSIDDLVVAQKEVVVATWKLDRRTKTAGGARSEQDIRSVSRAEGDLKARVERVSSTFRESTMRDPRRRAERGAGPATPRAGQTLPEEDDMAAAAVAMGKAVSALDALKTGDALQPEMEALNHLLRAQADVKRREVATQQSAGGGGGDNNRNFDLSALFDKELQRMQQTNYETPSSADERSGSKDDLLDKIKALAERQDELLKRQQELARQHLGEEELKRELEKLTREQSALREQAEELARESAKGKSESGQSSGKSGNGGSSAKSDGQRMRDVSEDMRSAAGDLRRQNPGQAAANGRRALEKLRQMQQRLQASQPDGRRRAAGEMQLEARQLADRQRQIASGAGQISAGESGKESARRLAGEQERLAERVKRLQDRLTSPWGGGSQADANVRAATAEAGRELERQRVAERMQQSAADMRAASQDSTKGDRSSARSLADAQQQIAGALDKIADRLASAAGSRDAESQKLSEQLARAEALGDRLNGIGSEADRLNRSSEAGAQGQALRDEYARQLQQTRQLIDQLRREDPSLGQSGGAGFTFEREGMALSAPGTEGFKQDFARWEQLRIQATQALEGVRSALSRKLQARETRDRLAAGVDAKAPPDYQNQVDSYFKAIATKKKP